jgi:hypothetical protein
VAAESTDKRAAGHQVRTEAGDSGDIAASSLSEPAGERGAVAVPQLRGALILFGTIGICGHRPKLGVHTHQHPQLIPTARQA